MIRTLGLQMKQFDYSAYNDDVGVEWQKWLRSFETMIRASRIKDEDWKKDLLLHYAGPNVQQLFETLPELPGKEMRGPLLNIENYTPVMTSYEEACTRLNKFFLPKENYTYERHLLRHMKKRTDESIDVFTSRLRVQADRCGFDDRAEEHIKDQIIQTSQPDTLRRDLLKRGDASLEEIVNVVKIYETVAKQDKSFALGDGKPQENGINRIDARPSFGRRRRAPELAPVECHRCGYDGHVARDERCPARGHLCNKCGGRDHFARKCRTAKKPYRAGGNWWTGNQQRSTLTKQDRSDAEPSTVKHIVNQDTEYIFNVTSSKDDGEMQCEIGGVAASAVIDSGSKYNLLSEEDWKKLKSSKIIVSNQRRETLKVFKAYGGQPLSLLGAFTATLKIGTKTELAEFYVVKGNGKFLIGRDTATAMGVLQISVPVNKVDTECKRLGTIKGIVVDIPIKTDVTPVVQPYRRIPVALEAKVDRKIDELLSQGVIEQVNEPSKWVSPLVVVPKGDDVRICIDMRRANEAVERENHPLPTVEDFLPHLAKAKIFSRLDVKNAFHQVGI